MLFLTLNFAATAQMEITFTASNYNGANVSCFGSQNGSVTVNVIGGTPPYTYLWSNDQTTQTISNLSAGYYNLTVSDSSGEQAESGVNLEEPKPLEVNLETPKYGNGYNVSCWNCYNGSIATTVMGGTTPYAYEWKDNQSTTQNRTGIKGGVYDLILTDNNGCVERRQIILTEPERSVWVMAGNANTDPTTNYIGTSDNKDLVVKTNGQERMRIGAIGNLKIAGLAGGSAFNAMYVDETGTLKIQQGPGGGGNTQTPCLTPLLAAWMQVSAASDDIYRCVGNVGIGVTNTSYLTKKLIVNGPVRFGDELSRNGLEIVSNTSTTVPVTPQFRGITLGYDDGGTQPDGSFNFWINSNQTYEGSSSFNFRNSAFNKTFLTINSNGKVGIGVNTPDPADWCPSDPNYLLWVRTGIRTEKLKVDLAGNNNWYDHVFSSAYEKKSLSEVEAYIKEYGHLPEIPSASEVKAEGIDVGDMIGRLLQKIEEMTLDVIRFESEIESIKLENANLKARIESIKK